MVTTTDPLNFVLESVRRQLEIEVTDPISNRNSNSVFISIGETKFTRDWPVITIRSLGPDSEEVSLGQEINSSDQAFNLIFPVQVQIFTSQDRILSSMSNDELLRNLGSQVLTGMLTRTNKQTMDGSYDIKQVSLIGGNTVLEDDNTGEFQLPIVFDVEFMYRF